MNYFVYGLALGFFLGALIMYQYVHAAGLFRTRKEFYSVRRQNGHPVPPDWDQEEGD
jgi:hypothetical protein